MTTRIITRPVARLIGVGSLALIAVLVSTATSVPIRTAEAAGSPSVFGGADANPNVAYLLRNAPTWGYSKPPRPHFYVLTAGQAAPYAEPNTGYADGIQARVQYLHRHAD